MFLAAYLRSPLARYFLFHTAASWGTERDTVHVYELMRLPFPLPGSDYTSARAERIVKEAATCVRKLRKTLAEDSAFAGHMPQRGTPRILDSHLSEKERRRLVDSAQGRLNGLVCEYFGLTQQEAMLVEDTEEIFIPSSTPSTWWKEDVFTLDPMQHPRPSSYHKGLKVYADTLTKTLNGWAAERGSTHRVTAKGGVDEKSGLALVSLELTKKEAPFQQIDVSRVLWHALDNYQQQVATHRLGTLASERDIIIFQGKKVHIVRPGILANWTRTAALNDAASLYAEIIAHGKTRA